MKIDGSNSLAATTNICDAFQSGDKVQMGTI
jgi:hypothetical protein